MKKFGSLSFRRGDCNFVHKTETAELLGAVGAVVYDNEAWWTTELITMDASPSETFTPSIPAVFISNADGLYLITEAVSKNATVHMQVYTKTVGEVLIFSGVMAILVSAIFILVILIFEAYRQRRPNFPKPIPQEVVISLPTKEMAAEDLTPATTCAVCLEDFEMGDKVREMPCQHIFHVTCIDPWLIRHNRLCPTCKRDITLKDGEVTSEANARLQAAQLVEETAIEMGLIADTRARSSSASNHSNVSVTITAAPPRVSLQSSPTEEPEPEESTPDVSETTRLTEVNDNT